MTDDVIHDAAGVVVAAESFLEELVEFVEENIVKVEVKVTEGPMLKEARKIIAEGLINLAKIIEDPSKEIKLIDIRKNKS